MEFLEYRSALTFPGFRPPQCHPQPSSAHSSLSLPSNPSSSSPLPRTPRSSNRAANKAAYYPIPASRGCTCLCPRACFESVRQSRAMSPLTSRARGARGISIPVSRVWVRFIKVLEGILGGRKLFIWGRRRCSRARRTGATIVVFVHLAACNSKCALHDPNLESFSHHGYSLSPCPFLAATPAARPLPLF
jgi:hypothetical protein